VTCDEEKINIQSTVLNSLYQADPDAAAPYIQQYLNTRDACTAGLRRSAIYLLANRGTEANTNLIIQLAKNDTVRSVRTQAIEVLSRMPSDAAIAALQQLMGDNDEEIQRAAVRSLDGVVGEHPMPRRGLGTAEAILDRLASVSRAAQHFGAPLAVVSL